MTPALLLGAWIIFLAFCVWLTWRGQKRLDGARDSLSRDALPFGSCWLEDGEWEWPR